MKFVKVDNNLEFNLTSEDFIPGCAYENTKGGIVACIDTDGNSLGRPEKNKGFVFLKHNGPTSDKDDINPILYLISCSKWRRWHGDITLRF